jgi:hypothetical protein
MVSSHGGITSPFVVPSLAHQGIIAPYKEVENREEETHKREEPE